MVRKRRGGVKINGKFYAFIGIVAAAVVAIIFIVTSINTVTVEAGEILFEQEFPVVIVRDEQVIYEENYGKANFVAEEGSRVEADQVVAEVYQWGYNEKATTELVEKQVTIQKYQENLLNDSNDANLDTINQDIENKAKELNTVINAGGGDVLKIERELKTLMNDRRTYLNDNVKADSDKKLEEYINDEKLLQERVDNSQKEIVAPQTGVVSYYFDGAEQVLNANNLQEITYADIDDILNGTTLQPETDEETSTPPLYRLVNNFKWYLLIDSPEAMRELGSESTFQIAFDDFPGRQFEGQTVGHVAEDRGYIYVVEILEDISELLSTRRADAKVFTRFEGMKVPEEAIVERDGRSGVIMVQGNDKTFVPVEARIIKDGSAIIEAEEGSALAVGSQIEV